MSGDTLDIQQLEDEIACLSKQLQEKRDLLSSIKIQEVRN